MMAIQLTHDQTPEKFTHPEKSALAGRRGAKSAIVSAVKIHSGFPSNVGIAANTAVGSGNG
jgi:hypothetical protein